MSTLEKPRIEDLPRLDEVLDDDLECMNGDRPADYRVSMRCCGFSGFLCTRCLESARILWRPAPKMMCRHCHTRLKPLSNYDENTNVRPV